MKFANTEEELKGIGIGYLFQLEGLRVAAQALNQKRDDPPLFFF